MNTLIVAWDDNRLIGSENKIPWKVKEDLKQFRIRTADHAMVMGRKTWESLGSKPLIRREHVVVSKTLDWRAMPDHSVAHANLVEAIEIARLAVEDQKEVFIIGGAQIYKEAMEKDLVDKMIVSHIHGSHEGDVYFPEFDESRWEVSLLSKHEEFDLYEYKRKL
ncbi:MAG: dihydrofolate reductase [Crenarchaeota archaeon]|nr:MAG: dihydrofolate reductase [Thermoproteota archaeon]